ncbi:hypothetical protein JCM30760_18060 [Thiomicrorhabdus hydrogeniphila]
MPFSAPAEIAPVKEVLPKEDVLEDNSAHNEIEQKPFIATEQLNTVEQESDTEVSQQSIEEANPAPIHVAESLPLLSVVVIGAGLEAVWQNEESLAWQLWQNIMKAFDWDENHVVFFDTDHLVTEDAIFSTMEEVIDLGVEWVLTMNEDHEITEQLAEGVQVVSVADFEQMLSDPYAKQSFYHSIINLGNP